MNNNKYKILVLSDLKSRTDSLLKSSVSLAKVIDANVKFLYVKKPIDLIKTDSQLSAIRTLNKEHIKVENNIKEILKPISKEYGLKLDYVFTFGNVKNEIKSYISDYKPDVIVLEKKQSKPLGFIGDNIVNLVLKTYNGPILIAANENALEPNKEFSLGVLDSLDQVLNIKFANELINHTTKPLKTFKIVESSDSIDSTALSAKKEDGNIEYVFEKSNDTLKSLSSYVQKSNINLLCLNRENTSRSTKAKKFKVNEIINKVNVSLLVNNTINIA